VGVQNFFAQWIRCTIARAKLLFHRINSPLHQLIRVDDEVEVIRAFYGGGEVAGVDEDGAEGMARGGACGGRLYVSLHLQPP
jgi:hypothetical protein